MSDLQKIVGLKVVAIKGYKKRKNQKKNIVAEFILFSDKKTFIELDYQDPYTYHDKSPSARELSVRQDTERWSELVADNTIFGDASVDW